MLEPRGPKRLTGDVKRDDTFISCYDRRSKQTNIVWVHEAGETQTRTKERQVILTPGFHGQKRLSTIYFRARSGSSRYIGAGM